jgi:hypothetical protein
MMSRTANSLPLSHWQSAAINLLLTLQQQCHSRQQHWCRQLQQQFPPCPHAPTGTQPWQMGISVHPGLCKRRLQQLPQALTLTRGLSARSPAAKQQPPQQQAFGQQMPQHHRALPSWVVLSASRQAAARMVFE